MPTKKKPSAKDLKAAVAKLQERLERAEARADRWKKKAKQLAKGAGKTGPTATPGPGPAPAPTPTPSGPPDGTWTLAMLRAEARTRGVAGYSRKTKAQLLAELG